MHADVPGVSGQVLRFFIGSTEFDITMNHSPYTIFDLANNLNAPLNTIVRSGKIAVQASGSARILGDTSRVRGTITRDGNEQTASFVNNVFPYPLQVADEFELSMRTSTTEEEEVRTTPVSYTHLTLPTIYSV